MHVHGFVALSSQFLFLSLFVYNGVVVVTLILIALSSLVLFATFCLYFPPRILTSEALVSITSARTDTYKSPVMFPSSS